MFELFDNSEQSFSWDSLINVQEGRKNLGEEMPVIVYRLFQYKLREELEKRFGKEVTIDIFRKAGELAGREFGINTLDLSLPFNEFVAQLQEILKESKIGVLRIERFDPETGEGVLTIAEDLDCSGLPLTGETVCNYDEGFLAGILKLYTKKDYVVTEIDCWATGDRVCRFEAHIR